ncbi:MAG: response regulator [Chloroflexi bacterium]|nr:response regulator [Chloroflexota bacterium]
MTDDHYRILILDDDAELGDLLREFLETTEPCTVTYVSTESAFWEQLDETNFDVLFLDYKLTETTGLEILGRMREQGVNIPTVMMTGEGSENIAARAIQSGAMDYLVKGDLSLALLPPLIHKAARERKIQQEMQRYLDQIRYQAMLLDNMRDAVVVWGLNGSITYWNAAAEQLYGAPASERIGRHVNDVYFPSFDPQPDWDELHKCGNLQMDHQYVLSNGSRLWISAHITMLKKDGGERAPFGFMNVARNITQHKQAQTHLAQAARLASIGELASSVAHQISNPLTTIIAEAQILSHELGPQHPAHDSAGAIIEAGWRAQKVINELMKFSQPSQAEYGPVSVNETIETALLLCSAHIKTLQVTIQVDLQPDLPEIIANERQLTDLWVTLLLLARSALNDGKEHTIRVRSQLLNGDIIQVEITDDGIPIPKEDYQTLFEPQLLPSGQGRGTGIELSICREIVRQNHGEIAITGSETETTLQISFSKERGRWTR